MAETKELEPEVADEGPPAPAPLVEVIIRPLAEGLTIRTATKHNVPEQDVVDSSKDLSAPWQELRFELKEWESLEVRPKLVGSVKYDYDQSANISSPVQSEAKRKAQAKAQTKKVEEEKPTPKGAAPEPEKEAKKPPFSSNDKETSSKTK